MVKHLLHIEWPHWRVSGSLRNSKQLKQESVEFKSSAFFLFLVRIFSIFCFIWIFKLTSSKASFRSLVVLCNFSETSLNFSLKVFSSPWSNVNYYSMTLNSLRFWNSCSSKSLFSCLS